MLYMSVTNIDLNYIDTQLIMQHHLLKHEAGL